MAPIVRFDEAMIHHRRTTFMSYAALAVALWLLNDRGPSSVAAQAAGDPWGRYIPSVPISVLSGARIEVALGRNISSDAARVGDPWNGTVTEYVMTRDENVIPPGSEVTGVVTGVTPAEDGSPAMLVLEVRSIRVNGHDQSIAASANPATARTSGNPFVLSDGTVMSFTAIQTVVIR